MERTLCIIWAIATMIWLVNLFISFEYSTCGAFLGSLGALWANIELYLKEKQPHQTR